MTDVEFTVRLLGDWTERLVCVLGSAPEIGTWDVEKALSMELVECQGEESVWRATVEFAANTNTLEYKYVLKHKQTRELISWEGLPGNRALTIAPGTNIALGAASCQSSTYITSRAPIPGPRDATLGNNGDTNGFQEWRCCRTNKEVNPWWEVDLGKEYIISSIHLWNAMTYHEQARHPEGRPPITSKTSTSSPSPPLWVFVSKEPLGREADSFPNAQAKAATSVQELKIDRLFDSRVRSLNFLVPGGDSGEGKPDTAIPIVKGRYVRLQYASASSALQFAELEVFTQDSAVSTDRKGGSYATSSFQADDGFYGVFKSLDGGINQYVESGWLNPAEEMAEVQLWIGSFDSTKPAIQWLSGEAEHNRVTVELRYERQTKCSDAVDLLDERSYSREKQNVDSNSITWKSLPVVSKGAALLDKESAELRHLLGEYQQYGRADVLNYLNNDPDGCGSPSEKVTPVSASWLLKLSFIQSLDATDVNRIAAKVNSQNYSEGEAILSYAEQRRAVFYVESGEVELFGPESSRGSNLIGTLSKGSFFNEMGIFSHWSKQPAMFKAKNDVKCVLLDFETLLAVLESDKVALIRDDIIRKRYVASSSSGKKIRLCTDNTHAQVFTVKAPVTAVDGSGCHSNGLSHRWTFDIYDCQSDVDSGSVKLLGSAYLLPFQINKHGEEDLTIPIFSTASHSIVGQLTLSYLVLMPFAHPKNNIAHVWRSYWRERPPLTIGHRGMGRSYYQVDGYRLALTRENTLASFIMAGRSGADFVEFDVQLTKDQVPIIYHDFLVNVGLEDKHAGSFGTKPEAYEIGIHDMTYRQLTQSHTTPVPHKGSKTQVLQNRLKKHWARLQGDKQVNSPRRGPITWDAEKDNIEEEHHLVDFFPRLEDLLKHVPAEVGLNVEIKYPDPLFGTAMRSSSQFAINAYLDKVLQCVFDHAGLRRIFFSCFDPNVCIALRAKQARYPVLFLTYGSMAPHAIDSRMTLQFATTFVKMEKLQGIVSNSKAFVETPELAPLVKRDLQSVLMTWGDQNTNHEMVQLQKRHAIDGVISDNVIDLINQDKKLQALAK